MLHFLDPGAGATPVGGTLVLAGDEAHHAVSVRRVRPGERVSVADGGGVWLEGECEQVERGRVAVRVDARREVELPSPRLVLVQALAKGDRDELAVQAAVELGAAGIVPWQAARSVSRWQGQKAQKGRARWQAIVRESTKQAHRAWLPEVEPIVTTAELTERVAHTRTVVLDPDAGDRLTAFRPAAEEAEIALVVGPEGGIEPAELDALRGAGASAMRLGDTVLRTSTAGPAGIALLNAGLGRW